MPAKSLLSLFLSVAAFALLTAGPLRAAEPAAFSEAMSLFDKANGGDGAATEPAVKALEALLAAGGPEAPLYQAYLSAAQTMQGRDAWAPWTKMKATERGLDTLDKALRRIEANHERHMVRGVPIALEARFVAASTFLTVPDSFFHRADRGRGLLQEVRNSPLYAAAPGDFRKRVEALAAGSR